MKKLLFLLKQKKHNEIIEYIMKNKIDFVKIKPILKIKIKIKNRYNCLVPIGYILCDKYKIDFPLDIDILSIKDKFGWSVAHEMAYRGYGFPKNRKDILMMKDNKNRTVYDIQQKKHNSYNGEAL